MMQLTRPLLLSLLLLVAGCGGGAPEETEPLEQADSVLPPPMSREDLDLTPLEREALALETCREVVQQYSTALERNAFEFASLFWDDPVIDGPRLAALHDGYVSPRISSIRAIEERIDGPVSCSVTAALIDGSNAAIPPRQGELRLRRMMVDGEQRWVIVQGTFIEPMQRAGRGEPA